MRVIPLGSVLGVQIRLDPSWFVVLVLVLWTFTAAVFPAQAPGRPAPEYLLMGAVATLLLFLSLLAHELAHSLVARARGISVEGITLFIFGGTARLGAESGSPEDEFLIAGAGPLVSVAISASLGGAAWTGLHYGWDVRVVAIALQLAVVNLVLALFNLLPGLPLDGGRLLRAAIWKVTGSLQRATRMAAAGGRAIGIGLILLGAIQLLASRWTGGVWLILIGAFVAATAEAGYSEGVLQSTLRGATVARLMTPAPVSVPAELPLDDFVGRFVLEGRHLGYPVVERDHPVGIITLHQVRSIPRGEWSELRVRSAMAPLDERLVVAPSDGVDKVLAKLPESSTGRLLVLHEGRLVGIVTRGDLARWLERARLLERS